MGKGNYLGGSTIIRLGPSSDETEYDVKHRISEAAKPTESQIASKGNPP